VTSSDAVDDLRLPAQRRARSERALVRAVARGEEAALAELFARFWGPAHHAAWLIVRDAAAAEDIAQEAFVSALAHLDRFDRRRPFGPWLHRIVVNRAIDVARARAARREVASDVLPEVGVEDARPIDASLLAALDGLPPEFRACVVLRHLLGYTPGDISRLLDIPRGTVNSRLRRGLDALKEAGVSR
jgi:RNA polymerase sigma-70 factor (ECF subfamily)